MRWLTKVLKALGLRISEGQNHGNSEVDAVWDGPSPLEDWSDFDNEEIDRAIAISLAEEEERAILNNDEDPNGTREEDKKGKKVIESESYLEEDEQLAKALQESSSLESPPRNDRPSVYRICAGCKAEIGDGQCLSRMGSVWHLQCFRCHDCKQPISDYEVSQILLHENRPYHKSCYKESDARCDVCKNFVPVNADGEIKCMLHPFWMQKYCPSHEHDGTLQCCSCERMEAIDARYLNLDDGRNLCLECLDSAIMDTHECQPLYLEIQEFYEGLNMKVEQQIPLLLVERQALNEAMEGEKNGHHHLPETRGLCLSEEQIIPMILRQPTIGGNRVIHMFTEPYRLIRKCEVTAILILYGLPRLLAGSILAHEMMHAWLRLKGYPNLTPDVEEGICQVLAHMWLDSEIMAGSGCSNAASSSTSLSGSSSSKKGKRSEFERKLGEYFKHQIESDASPAYGGGFREGNNSVLQYGLKGTLDHILLTRCFP